MGKRRTIEEIDRERFRKGEIKINEIKGLGLNVEVITRNAHKMCRHYGLESSCYEPKKRDTKRYRKEDLYLSR